MSTHDDGPARRPRWYDDDDPEHSALIPSPRVLRELREEEEAERQRQRQPERQAEPEWEAGG